MEKDGAVCSTESPRPLQCDPNEPGSYSKADLKDLMRTFWLSTDFLMSSPLVNIFKAPLARLTVLSQREAPRFAIFYSASESLGRYWDSHRPNDSVSVRNFGTLGICGLISSMATHPIDLVKRRLQLDGGGGQPRLYNDGIFGTFKNIVKPEGPRGLYRGVLPDFLKVFPRVGLACTMYEMVTRNNSFAP